MLFRVYILFALFLLPAAMSAFAKDDGKKFCGYNCETKDALAAITNIQKVGVAPAVGCNPSDVFQVKDMASGARATMALVYGSCDVLKLPIRPLIKNNKIPKGAVSFHDKGRRYINGTKGLELVRQNHPYLSQRYRAPCDDVEECAKESVSPPVSCKQISCFTLKYPALYQYGSKPKVDAAKNANSVFVTTGSGISESSGIDCSGYLFESMSISGLRAKPNEKLIDSGTSYLWSLGAETKDHHYADCFERIMGEPGIKSGDVIVAANLHSVIIDTVGNDPFGIDALLALPNSKLVNTFKQIQKERPAVQMQLDKLDLDKVLAGKEAATAALQALYLDNMADIACDQLLLDPEQFRVTIADSSPGGGNVGVQRTKAYPSLQFMPESLTIKAHLDCVHSLKSKWITSVKTTNPDFAARITLDTPYTLSMKQRENDSRGTRIIRHEASRPGCTEDKKPDIKGLNCMSCCSLNSSYSEQVPTEVKNGEFDDQMGGEW